MTQEYFGPAPKSDPYHDDLKRWLANQTISFQKILTGSLQVGQELSSANYVADTSGWYIDGSGNAEFNDVVLRGDLYSSNWDGAVPADLSSGPVAATLGYYLDSSAGAAQFTGPVYFAPPDEDTEGTGVLLEFGDSFFLRVYQNNPTSGEDSLYIGPGTNNLDHIVLGPPGGSDKLKNLRFKTVEVEVEGTLRFDTTPGAANEQIIFDDIDYSIFQDNTGAGADNSRLWFDAPDGGQVVFGPRSGGQYLDRFDVLSDAFRLEWEDSGGDVGIHTWPKGIVYDWDFDTTTGEATAGAFSSNITGLVTTVSVPQDISVTIMVWGHIRLDQSTDINDIVFFGIEIGGSLPVLPAANEQDLTTDTDASSASATTTSNANPDVTGVSGGASAGTAHTHTDGSYGTATHSHTLSHTHSHSHALSQQFHTLSYMGMRTFTPTGTTVDIQAVGGSTSGAVTYDDGLIMALVLVN